MTLSIIPVNQIFGKYDQQTRMGELNRKNPVKTIQNQVDRVTISPEALKKRAIDAALAAIQNSSQVSTEAKPTSEENVEPLSYADKVTQNALEKSKERKEKEKEGLQDQADSVRNKFLEKAAELKDKAAAAKKELYEKEATPF
jgi:cysteinyl-tRNA synthetase